MSREKDILAAAIVDLVVRYCKKSATFNKMVYGNQEGSLYPRIIRIVKSFPRSFQEVGKLETKLIKYLPRFPVNNSQFKMDISNTIANIFQEERKRQVKEETESKLRLKIKSEIKPEFAVRSMSGSASMSGSVSRSESPCKPRPRSKAEPGKRKSRIRTIPVVDISSDEEEEEDESVKEGQVGGNEDSFEEEEEEEKEERTTVSRRGQWVAMRTLRMVRVSVRRASPPTFQS